MNVKLTLRLDKNMINRIKMFAANRNQSLSKFTENLFKQILDSEETKLKQFSPRVRKYKGVLKNITGDERDYLTEYLENKHK